MPTTLNYDGMVQLAGLLQAALDEQKARAAELLVMVNDARAHAPERIVVEMLNGYRTEMVFAGRAPDGPGGWSRAVVLTDDYRAMLAQLTPGGWRVLPGPAELYSQ